MNKNAEIVENHLANLMKLGFKEVTTVFSLRTIAHLFGASKSRCGIYLLGFSDKTFYIGQACNVVRRFVQHRRRYSNISSFAFVPAQQTRLDKLEKRLIFKAQDLGITLLNSIHMADVVGETDLDLVVSQAEQKARESGTKVGGGKTPLLSLPKGQVLRFANAFESFKAGQHANAAREILAGYVHQCLPFPKRTEYSFWAVSCMPSTNKSTWPRLVCVSAGMMELLVIGYDIEEPTKMWGFINVASDVLKEKAGGLDLFKKQHPKIKITKREGGYRDGGPHQASLHAWDEVSLRSLLKDKAVCKAAGALALRVMKKRATIYSKFHCKQLANSVLSMNT